MARAPTDIRSLARQHTDTALRVLAAIAARSESDGARVQACVALLDRGWGKPATVHTGPDGEGDIRVTIRHILQNGAHIEENARVLEMPAPQAQLAPVDGDE